MRIHTDILVRTDIHNAVRDERIAYDVHPVVLSGHGSQKRERAFEVQLGTYDNTSGPTRSRRYKNSGTHGAGRVWAATYDEWGWFLANLFSLDPKAIAGPYNGREDFIEKTNGAYESKHTVAR